MLHPDALITMAELHDLVTVDGGAMRMWGELVKPGRRAQNTMTWSFETELPLSSAATDIVRADRRSLLSDPLPTSDLNVARRVRSSIS